MSDALRAEWTKLRTLSGTWWLLVGTVAVTVALAPAIVASTHLSPVANGRPARIRPSSPWSALISAKR